MRAFRYSDGRRSECGDLFEALALGSRTKVISLIGSGGKSTVIRRLAREANARGLSVVVTTTTHILAIDNFYEDPREALSRLESDRIVTIARRSGAKLTRPDDDILAAVYETAGLVLIEADGSRRLPLKYPAGYEPVIEPATDTVVLVAGLSALGRRFGDVCQRVELAEQAIGLSPDAIVDPGLLCRLLSGYPARPELLSPRACILLNQADTPERLAAADETAACLLRRFSSAHPTAFAAGMTLAAASFSDSERIIDRQAPSGV